MPIETNRVNSSASIQAAVTWLLSELSQTPKTINACPARLQAKTNCSKNKGILSRRLIQILMAQRIIPSPQMFWLSVRKLTKTAEIKPQKNSADNQPETPSNMRRKNAGCGSLGARTGSSPVTKPACCNCCQSTLGSVIAYSQTYY